MDHITLTMNLQTVYEVLIDLLFLLVNLILYALLLGWLLCFPLGIFLLIKDDTRTEGIILICVGMSSSIFIWCIGPCIKCLCKNRESVVAVAVANEDKSDPEPPTSVRVDTMDPVETI
jgi:ABC-type dipeptide/oligopeptide/nickel transport system permease component